MADTFRFYNVRKGASVDIPLERCEKVRRPMGTGSNVCRYVRAVDDDGNTVCKFVSREVWDGLGCREGVSRRKA